MSKGEERRRYTTPQRVSDTVVKNAFIAFN